jgi:hypothetical protein
MGLELSLSLHAASSAAIGICRRTGIGRVRHLAVGQLWVQEQLRRGAFTLHKLRGDCYPADLCMKHLTCSTATFLIDLMGIVLEKGRAISAPHVNTEVEVLPF